MRRILAYRSACNASGVLAGRRRRTRSCHRVEARRGRCFELHQRCGGESVRAARPRRAVAAALARRAALELNQTAADLSGPCGTRCKRRSAAAPRVGLYALPPSASSAGMPASSSDSGMDGGSGARSPACSSAGECSGGAGASSIAGGLGAAAPPVVPGAGEGALCLLAAARCLGSVAWACAGSAAAPALAG